MDVVIEDLNKFPFFARLWVREPLVVLAHHLLGRTAFSLASLPFATATYLADEWKQFGLDHVGLCHLFWTLHWHDTEGRRPPRSTCVRSRITPLSNAPLLWPFNAVRGFAPSY